MFGLSRRRVVLVCTVLLLAIVAGALSIGGAPPLWTFAVSTVALAGLAWLVSMATESVGEHFGPAVTGVLQSTLGNLPELFVVFFALKAGELVVAQTSILGSLFANALLVLGAVIVVGARRSPDRVMRFQARLAEGHHDIADDGRSSSSLSSAWRLARATGRRSTRWRSPPSARSH